MNINNNSCCSICIDTKKLKDNYQCPQCKNFFHQECINQWILKNPTCPICRFKIEDDFIDYDIDGLIMFNEVDLVNAFIKYYKELFYDFNLSFFF